MTAHTNPRHMPIVWTPATASLSDAYPRSWLGRLADRTGLTGFRQRLAAIAELNAASDRDLRDMGISRSDIGRVFDPAFAEDYARRGARTQSAQAQSRK